MQQYIQDRGTEIVLLNNVPIIWDANNYCTPDTLHRDGKAEQFNVYPLEEVEPPEYDEYTESLEISYYIQNGIGKTRYTVKRLNPSEIEGILLQFKEQKNTEINQSRLQANRSFFVFQGKEIACDELSRSDIDGVNGYIALYGAMPPNWIGGWKAIDNTYVSIPDISTWRIFFNAMYQTGTDNFNKAQQLKALINSKTAVQEVQAISWETEV